ncbi:MAG: twin-arginine translocase subunit TatC [Betaproteobacteria bacterium]|nr:twin-arginine translocase subunit TatC [Betaproteobacteria bacterium]
MSENFQETFISHLVELRDRLVKCIQVFAIAAIPAAYFAPEIYNVLAQPMVNAMPHGARMIATGVVAPFLIPLKVALWAAFLVVLPYILYQAWAFIAPGLYQHEKRFVLPLVFSSTLLFLTGIAFCYFVVFPLVFAGIEKFAPTSITVATDIENYFNFALNMFFAFGLAFETPVVVIVLVATGIVRVETLVEIRRYAIVGATVIAAVVTPPDVGSMLALAIPLCLLYELGIILARIFVKPRQPETEPAA